MHPGLAVGLPFPRTLLLGRLPAHPRALRRVRTVTRQGSPGAVPVSGALGTDVCGGAALGPGGSIRGLDSGSRVVLPPGGDPGPAVPGGPVVPGGGRWGREARQGAHRHLRAGWPPADLAAHLAPVCTQTEPYSGSEGPGLGQLPTSGVCRSGSSRAPSPFLAPGPQRRPDARSCPPAVSSLGAGTGG